ncbi:hypothetical protein F4808DRAFT_449943 [Astrocystis sublimbata]|nr:hypothetical protein F4808DRAFT_449943 [Astrocystis sublimbata]
MSDLKYILDAEDDEDLGMDKYSRQPRLSGSARSPIPSSTSKTTSDDNPSRSNIDLYKPQPSRRSPLNRSPNTTIATAPPAKAPSSEDKASPYRSSFAGHDRTEPMDSVGYGSYAHSSSSSNMPPSSRSNMTSRPMTSGPGESNIPIKLTPVTGRVSRAKKGVPVHVCNDCKPPKTFTRAEHLRRHQLSHKPAAFPCPCDGCEKTFHRQDLLARHIQRHEQDDRSGTDVASNASRRTSHTPMERNPSVDIVQAHMLPNHALSLVNEMPAHPDYPGTSSSYSASHRGSMSAPGPMSPSTHSPRSHSAGPQDEYILSSTIPPVSYEMPRSSMDGSYFQTTSYGLEFQPRRPPEYPYMSLEGLPSLTIPDSSLPGHLSHESNWPSSASGSPYSTPDGAMIRGYESPTPDVANHELYYFSSPQQPVYPIPDYTAFSEDAGGYYDLQSQPFSVRSPTPPTVMLSAQPVDNLVTLNLSMPNSSAILGRQKNPAALLGSYPDAAVLTALIPSSAAHKAIPRYLDVYWKRFDALFPLVHRQSLEISDDLVLRCAMAAVGSQFLQNKEDRNNGHILHQFAWQEAQNRPGWNLHNMQAILLCEFYGRFRGSRAMTRTSEPFQSLYSRMVDSQTSIDFGTSPAENWEEWILTESRRRLLAAYYILDVHTSVYHENSSSHLFTPTSPIPLVKATQQLWAAQDPKAWQSLIRSDPTQLQPNNLADEEITKTRVQSAPPLDLAIYMASEALRLPDKDLSAALDLESIKRISTLFPESAVANTYLAIHFTPLRGLLAVCGNSWLFAEKVSSMEKYERHKQNFHSWSNSVQAGVAATFAAKALLAFLTGHERYNSQNSANSAHQREESNISDISDYWALYVSALICWATGARTARSVHGRNGNGKTGLSSVSTHHAIVNPASAREEKEAKEWLKMVASLSPETAFQRLRGRREAFGVIALVRRRLESETVGNKSKLLMDVVHVLKRLDEDFTKQRF